MESSKPDFQSLTPRERECLLSLEEAGDVKSVARRLGLSPHTVNNHLQAAMRKLQVRKSDRAARLYKEHVRASSDHSSDEFSPVDDLIRNNPLVSSPSAAAKPVGMLQEQRVTYSFASGDVKRPARAFVRGEGERGNSLSTSQRLQAIVTIAVGIGVICLLTILVGSTLTYWALHRR